MALDTIVKNAINRLSMDNDLGLRVYRATMKELGKALRYTSEQIDMQLNPEVNESLQYMIEGFSINSTKDSIDPSQLYSDMVNIYKQNLFGNDKLANIYMLSALYIRALKKLGNPDPITGRREGTVVTRQEREVAQNIANTAKNLLAESLYNYYGGRVTMAEIMANTDRYASVFYGAYRGVINQIESYILTKTPNISLLESSTRLMSTIDEMSISSIEGIISAIYPNLRIPEAVSLILDALGQIGFYKSIFEEISGEIGYYIGQGLKQQQNQPAGQQPNTQLPQQNLLVGQQQGGQSPQVQPPQPAQPGQPGNQPNAQQQNQFQQQFHLVIPPYVIGPQNLLQQTQQAP